MSRQRLNNGSHVAVENGLYKKRKKQLTFVVFLACITFKIRPVVRTITYFRADNPYLLHNCFPLAVW